MKKLTLSFDNGPTETVTPEVLDILAARELGAYFCVVGTQLQAHESHPAICRQALASGHRLVNHSLTHTTPLGECASETHARAEIHDMHTLMHTLLGEWGELWFRPFGREGALGPHVFSPAALAQFRALEYSVMLWNSVPRDWVDPVGWVDRALGEIAARDHTLVVLHDIDSGAMKHLPRFLDTLLDQGVTFTFELPSDCVPVRNGVENESLLRDLVCKA